MPSSKSAREKRKLARDKKKPKAENYRKGGEPHLFNFYRDHFGLSTQILFKEEDIAGKTDEVSVRKQAALERIKADLPAKFPEDYGYPPLEGERDHFYLRYFRILTKQLISDQYHEHIVRDEHGSFSVSAHLTSWLTVHLRLIRAYLYYFDEGEHHPLAKKPPIRRRQLAHIRYMKAKRAREAQAN